MCDNNGLSAIQRQRQELPIFQARKDILQVVKEDDCMIFIAETACGKTTQVPQFLYEAGLLLKGKMIGITQPRRVAAITIAERVAEEMGVPLGGKVGYSVRFDDMTTDVTKIKYVTDGTLLRESINDPLLMDYSVIILDEAHERTVHTDILFGIVKSAQLHRKENDTPLKVIIMSATLDCEHFSKYFNDAPSYSIRGRQYDITILNVSKKHDDYVLAALTTVFQIHHNEDKGDILVFATGQEEIDYMVSEVEKGLHMLCKEDRGLLPYPLYAALPSAMQLEALKPTPKGFRKVIFATNIAETSLTIPGIKYVIDTGMVKTKTYNPIIGLDVLKVQRISKEQAEQRTGRAGREKIGFCYRLYTVEEYQAFENRTIPEIQRCSLGTVILQVTALGIKNIRNFDFLDKPVENNINAGIQQLRLLGAVDEVQEELKLTQYGQIMVHFPLDPRFSKMIMMSKKLRCTDDILSIISLMSVESIFFTPSKQKNEALQSRKKFSSGEGDHLMLLNMYRWFKKNRGNVSNKIKWCSDNFINYKSMQKVLAIRKQLKELCQRLGIPPCSCQDTMTIRKCLTMGLFMNAAELQKDKSYKTIDNNKVVHIHPSSSLFSSQLPYVIYTDLVETTKCYMRNLSAVHAALLKEVAPEYFKEKRYIGTRIINHC